MTMQHLVTFNSIPSPRVPTIRFERSSIRISATLIIRGLATRRLHDITDDFDW
jgi:hypothetical protein